LVGKVVKNVPLAFLLDEMEEMEEDGLEYDEGVGVDEEEEPEDEDN
jgi:hypothetical protein